MPDVVANAVGAVWAAISQQAPGTLVGIVIGFLLGSTRGLVGRRIVGTAPRLRIEPDDSHPYWAHIAVTNVGLPFARKTRPARDARATVVFDVYPEKTYEFCWSSADKRPPPLEVDGHRGRAEQLPFVLFYAGDRPVEIYEHSIDNTTAFITEVEFLTQGSPNERSVPGRIGEGDYPFTLTVRYDEVESVSQRMSMHVRKSPMLEAWLTVP